MVKPTVKILSAMQETQVRSLGWEDPLEKGMATYSSIFASRIPMDTGLILKVLEKSSLLGFEN